MLTRRMPTDAMATTAPSCSHARRKGCQPVVTRLNSPHSHDCKTWAYGSAARAAFQAVGEEKVRERGVRGKEDTTAIAFKFSGEKIGVKFAYRFLPRLFETCHQVVKSDAFFDHYLLNFSNHLR